MAIEPRPAILAAPFCPHGSLCDAEREARGWGGVLDFSVNGNPLGPSPGGRRALATCDPYTYPDDTCQALRQALSARLGVDPRRLVVGNGSVELLWLLAAAYLRPGDNVLVVGPTFGEYARAATLAGAAVDVWSATPPDFAPDVDGIAATVASSRAAPGLPLQPEQPYRRVPASCGGASASWRRVMSACWWWTRLTSPSSSGLTRCLLWWGKAALAALDHQGLRTGRAAAGLCRRLTRGGRSTLARKPPWSVNAAALAAGLAALTDEEHVRRGREVALAARDYLASALARLGLGVVPSATNLLLVRVGEARSSRGRDCCARLLRARLHVVRSAGVRSDRPASACRVPAAGRGGPGGFLVPAKTIMVQGTASSAGKSILVTALCRIFRQDGLRVAPYKSQNMALNSFVTADGGEIGRSQAVQAEAAGAEMSVDMNPILLKPEADSRCQVVVRGPAVAAPCRRPSTTTSRTNLWPLALESLDRLREQLRRRGDRGRRQPGRGEPARQRHRQHAGGAGGGGAGAAGRRHRPRRRLRLAGWARSSCSSPRSGPW